VSISVRSSLLGGLVVLCVLAGGVAIEGATAQAAVRHKLLSKITEVPAEGPHKEAVPVHGALAGPSGMTVDSGDLWTTEEYFNPGVGPELRVDEFDAASGAFVSQLPQQGKSLTDFQGVAVGHATGEMELYVTGDAPGLTGAVGVFGAAGALQGVWEGHDTQSKSFGCFGCSSSKASIAVDNSPALGDWAVGDVYVSVPEKNVVDVFTPEAGGKEKYVRQITGPSPSEPFVGEVGGVTVDQANGDVLVYNDDALDIFKPTLLHEYEFVGKVTGPPGQPFPNEGIAALGTGGGEGDGDIYVGFPGRAAPIIYQFNAEGVYLGELTGFGGEVTSVAVDPASHELYVGVKEEVNGNNVNRGGVEVYSANIVFSDVSTGPAVNATPYGATLTGTVKLDKEGEATCGFVWGTTTEFGHSAPCSAPVTAEESHVEATLSKATGSELEPDTTYYYRLQATNKNGTNSGEPTQDQHFTTPGPGIHSESVSNVAGTSATLETSIDPNKAFTTYYFQYGTSGAYEATAPAAPGSPLGAGEGDVEASQHVQGLTATTPYHYRVVAVSELSPGHFEAFYGPDQTFTTQGSGAFTLLDGRQWEMATPLEKNGALFLPLGSGFSQEFTSKAAASGDAIVDEASQPVENESSGSGLFAEVLSARAPSGWYSQTLTPEHAKATGLALGNGGEYFGFSEDLSLGILHELGQTTPLSPEASEATPYLRNDYLNGEIGSPCKSSCFSPLVTRADTAPGTVFGTDEVNGKCEVVVCGPEIVEATPDAHHVLLGSEVPLTEGPSAATYEWSAGEPPSKQLQPVAQLPASEGGGVVGLPQHKSERGPYELSNFSLSSDGSYFFSSGGHLYVHDTGSDESFRLDVAQGVSEPASGHAELLYASLDGSMVLFDDPDQLTSAAGGGVYECRVAEVAGRQACTSLVLTGLVGGAGPFALPNGKNGEEALLGSSVDGSYLYFLGDEYKLYVDHDDGAGWKQTLVAALAPGVEYPQKNEAMGDSKDWTEALYDRTLRVSPDGEWLAFMSQRSLTGYDNDDVATGLPDQEVYEYNAKTAQLACASCDPTGARPVGTPYVAATLVGADSLWPEGTGLAADIPPWTRYEGSAANYQSRYLSDDGRLFFNSYEGLVPDDVNGQWDVYEYEPEGVSSCASSVSSGSVLFRSSRSFEVEGAKGEEGSGCVGLISSGTSPEESAFLDASEGGGSVFFLTQAKLESQDVDTSLDVYDAHECTSESPCLAPPAEPAPVCVSESSCKPSPTPQPSIYGLPSSATFSGPGDVTPPSVPATKVEKKTVNCKRGLVKDKRGKCVRAKSKRKRAKAKKSIDRKGSR
jgi:hypothetical protein